MKKLLVAISLIFFTNYANAQNVQSVVTDINANKKIKKDVEKKLSQYGRELIKYSYNKKFAYCDLSNGTLECRNQNIFCVIIPYHNGDYNLNYEVADCNWIKYPDGYYDKVAQDLEMQKTHVKIVSGSIGNLKARWVKKEEIN